MKVDLSRYKKWLVKSIAVCLALSMICVTNAQTQTKQEFGGTSVGEVYPQYPKISYGVGAKAEQIKRGETLVKAGDCIACHTAPGGPPFAGGLGIKTPFGTMFSQNITPDKKTGIGNWTDEQFIRAMKEGISPTGSFYFPAFPYNYFNRLSDQEVLDIKAYLASIPAVELENKPLDMPFPFKIRLLQSFWRFLYFDFQKGEYQQDPSQTAEWNQGAKLVQGLGHCSMCHTPMNFLGAPVKKYYLGGGFFGGFYAPNITSTHLGNVPVEKIVNVFMNDQMIEGRKVQGPMLEVNHNSLRFLAKSDLESIATYLKTVKSQKPPAPKVATGASAGKSVYETYCAGCHTNGSGGAPKLGTASDWTSRMSLGVNTLYTNAIVGIGGMPPKGTCSTCTDQEIQAAVDYILEKSVPAGTEISAAPTAAKPEEPKAGSTSLARGKEVYTKVCSICHAQGQLGAPKVGDQSAWEPLVKQNMDVLINRAIDGYKGHPAMGSCYNCNDADIIAAVKYMVNESVPTSNYSLW